MIDSHIHLWTQTGGYDVWIRRKIAGIDRDFTVADWRRASAAAAPERAVLVHATEHEAETDHLLRLAASEEVIAAVVGWADVAGAGLGVTLDRFMRAGKFRGLRVMPAFGAGVDWLLREEVMSGFAELARRGLTLDLLVRPEQLPAVLRIKERVPDLPIILNHCGRPITATGQLEPWATALRAVAWSTDVRCKLSSLAERAGMDWHQDLLQPYLDVTLEAFGPGRLAFGSNWPVVNIAASYAGWWTVLEAMLERHALSAEDRHALFHGTAASLYRID